MTTKLLAVDDSKTMRRVLEITFSGDEFQTTIASSANQAMAAVRADPPQVAVIDAHLGSESGYDLCQALKAVAPATRVLILASKQRPYDEARGRSVGADGFFEKPFDSTKMIARVSQESSLAGPAAGPGAAAPVATPAAASRAAVAPAARAPVAPVAAAPRSAPAVATSGVESSGRRPVAPLPRTSASPPSASLSGGPAASPRAPAAPIAARPVAAAAPRAGVPSDLETKLKGLGLTASQIDGVLALSKEVVEQVVWEVVPQLAEAMIKEEIARLTAE